MQALSQNSEHSSCHLKIALLGYGKMGQALEKAAEAAGHAVVAIIDPAFAGVAAHPVGAAEITRENLRGAEVAIDFTHPHVVLGNLQKLAALGVPAVVGTTGWYAAMPAVAQLAQQIGILYAGNFSIGVQLFYAAAAALARQLAAAGGYDVGVLETHHTGKADAPSGTARELAAHILANFPTKTRVLLDNAEQPVPPEALQIVSSRIGQVVGIHTAVFDGASDTIEITHRGKNRAGYACGAVAGAEWLVRQPVGLFTAREWLGVGK